MKQMWDKKELIDIAEQYGGGGGTGAVQSVNGKTGKVVLKAEDIKAKNAQTIQANLERIDSEINRVEAEIPDVSGLATKEELGNYVTLSELDEKGYMDESAVEAKVESYHDDSKQNKLTAGANITIDENNVISATGGGSGGGTAVIINGQTKESIDLTNVPLNRMQFENPNVYRYADLEFNYALGGMNLDNNWTDGSKSALIKLPIDDSDTVSVSVDNNRIKFNAVGGSSVEFDSGTISPVNGQYTTVIGGRGERYSIEVVNDITVGNGSYTSNELPVAYEPSLNKQVNIRIERLDGQPLGPDYQESVFETYGMVGYDGNPSHISFGSPWHYFDLDERKLHWDNNQYEEEEPYGGILFENRVEYAIRMDTVAVSIYEPIEADAVPVDYETIIIEDGKIKAVGGGGGEPDEYIKNASISGNTLTLIKKDDTTIEFTPQGGGGDIPANMMTTDTEQVITGKKTWQGEVDINAQTPGCQFGLDSTGTASVQMVGDNGFVVLDLVGHPDGRDYETRLFQNQGNFEIQTNNGTYQFFGDGDDAVARKRDIQGGGGGTSYTAGRDIKIENNVISTVYGGGVDVLSWSRDGSTSADLTDGQYSFPFGYEFLQLLRNCISQGLPVDSHFGDWYFTKDDGSELRASVSDITDARDEGGVITFAVRLEADGWKNLNGCTVEDSWPDYPVHITANNEWGDPLTYPSLRIENPSIRIEKKTAIDKDFVPAQLNQVRFGNDYDNHIKIDNLSITAHNSGGAEASFQSNGIELRDQGSVGKVFYPGCGEWGIHDDEMVLRKEAVLKEEITTETWTFTTYDGQVITKNVVIK